MTQPKYIDRYEVREVIGTGAMGAVFAGWDPKLRRDVAIKLIRANLAKDKKVRDRFSREARAIAALRHPNIVEIYDYSGADSQQLYLVMERLEGDDLFNLVDASGVLPQAAVAAVGHELCLALSVAHNAGTIHRDLKPENVFISPNGRVVLTDFGIVKAITQNAVVTGWDATTDIIGTPGFMAPEVMRDQALGPYTDIFALGALLYNVATGVVPFEAFGPIEMYEKIQAGDFENPRIYNQSITDDMCRLLKSMLQAQPQDRPKSVGAVSQELKQILSESGVTDLRDDMRAYMKNAKEYWHSAQKRSAAHLIARIKIASKDKDIGLVERLRMRLRDIDPSNEAVKSITGLVTIGGAISSTQKRSPFRNKQRKRLVGALGVGILFAVAGNFAFHLWQKQIAKQPLVSKEVQKPGLIKLLIRNGDGTLYLDGQKVSHTTKQMRMVLRTGKRHIELRGKKHTLKHMLTVHPGSTTNIEFDLKSRKVVVR